MQMVYMVKTDHQINKSFRLLCKTGRYFFTRLLILEKIWSWIVANNKQFSVCYFFLTSNICNVKSLIRIFQQILDYIRQQEGIVLLLKILSMTYMRLLVGFKTSQVKFTSFQFHFTNFQFNIKKFEILIIIFLQNVSGGFE